MRCIGLAVLMFSSAGGVIFPADEIPTEAMVVVPSRGEFRRVRCGHEHVPAPEFIPELGPELYAGRAVFAPVARHERM